MSRPALEQLLVIQDLDTGLDRVAARRRALPERSARDSLRARIAELDAAGQVRRSERDLVAERQASLERELDAADRRDRQIAQRLRTVTVPREAEALQAEQRTLAGHKASLEDDAFARLEELEVLDQAQAGDDERRAALLAQLASAQEALEEAEAGLRAEEAGLVAGRDRAVAEVPADLLERYERLRERMGGVAIARLEGNRCLGCHLTLSTSGLERLRHAADDAVTTCEQCGRLLVR